MRLGSFKGRTANIWQAWKSSDGSKGHQDMGIMYSLQLGLTTPDILKPLFDSNSNGCIHSQYLSFQWE